MASNTQSKRKAASESLLFLLVAGGILVALNVLGGFQFFRCDLTEDKLFTLSDGSKRVVKDLDDRMEVVGYFTEDLPPPHNSTERYVRDILNEYKAVGGANFIVRMVAPETEETKEEAQNDGMLLGEFTGIENDSPVRRQGYKGLVIRYLGEVKTFPIITTTDGLEYQLTQAFKELTGEKRPVGVIGGHEGPTVAEGLTKMAKWMPTYEFREVSATEAISDELEALLIVGPKTEFSDAELQNINAYVMNGGSLGVFGGGMKMTLDGPEPRAEIFDSKLNTLLRPYGLELGQDVLLDAQCGRAPMQTPIGIALPVAFPPVPILTFDEAAREHPALYRLDNAPLPFVSSVKAVEGAEHARVLVSTSENSWRETSTAAIGLAPRDPREWRMTADTGPFGVVGVAEGTLPSAFTESSGEGAPSAPAQSTSEVRVIVVGGSSVFQDQFLPEFNDRSMDPRQLNSGLAFALNSIDWLAQDSDMIAIRAKNVEDPTLNVPAGVESAQEEAQAALESQDVEGVEAAIEKIKQSNEEWNGKKSMYRWLNTLGIPVLFAIFGLVRWRMRQNRTVSL